MEILINIIIGLLCIVLFILPIFIYSLNRTLSKCNLNIKLFKNDLVIGFLILNYILSFIISYIITNENLIINESILILLKVISSLSGFIILIYGTYLIYLNIKMDKYIINNSNNNEPTDINNHIIGNKKSNFLIQNNFVRKLIMFFVGIFIFILIILIILVIIYFLFILYLFNKGYPM